MMVAVPMAFEVIVKVAAPVAAVVTLLTFSVRGRGQVPTWPASGLPSNVTFTVIPMFLPPGSWFVALGGVRSRRRRCRQAARVRHGGDDLLGACVDGIARVTVRPSEKYQTAGCRAAASALVKLEPGP